MNYKKHAIVLVTVILVVLAAIAAFVAVVDPYQLYRKSDKYTSDQRNELAGIVRHHDYDALIMGSSMMMNSYPEQVDSLFGWKSINCTFMGAVYDDFAVALPLILSQGKAKHIIMGIDYFTFAMNQKRMPEYLWDENPFNDVAYLFNYTSIKNAFKILRQPAGKKNLYHYNSPSGRKYVMEDYRKNASSYFENKAEMDSVSMSRNFHNSVGRFMESTKDVEWILLFPPYSAVEFQLLAEQGHLEDVLAWRRETVDRYSRLPNVKIYDFQGDEALISNLDEFMDMHHHSHAYNRLTMREIARGAHRTDSTLIRAANCRLREIVNTCPSLQP